MVTGPEQWVEVEVAEPGEASRRVRLATTRAPWRFGRRPDADVPLMHTLEAAQTQCRLCQSGADLVLECFGVNATLLNGAAVDREVPTPVVPGDRIGVGETVITILGPASDTTTEPH